MTDRDEQETVQGASRRAVLLGAGALGAVGVLAACGTDTPSTTAPTPGGDGTASLPPLPSAGAPAAAIKTSDIPKGGGKIFPEQIVVVTQPTDGVFKAFDATCQHMGCIVSSVEDGKIMCKCHGSQYNIADGSVARGPTTKPLPAKNVSVTGENITVS